MDIKNTSLRYMDCPVCGREFSYNEVIITDENQHVFIRCPHCTASFLQPVVDDVNILETWFDGATTAPVDAENVLDTLEIFVNESGKETSEELTEEEKEEIEEIEEIEEQTEEETDTTRTSEES